MKLDDLKKDFIHPFPKSVKTLGFGPDLGTFEKPRGHFAHDFALPMPLVKTPPEYPLVAPFTTARTKWWPIAQEGGNKDVTWLDFISISGDYVFRMCHIYADEIFPDAARRIFPNGIPEVDKSSLGTLMPRGAPIGPAGDSGLSLAKGGYSARHLHGVLLLRPGAFDDILAEKWGEWWNSDQMPAWGAKYPGLLGQMQRNGWTLANDHVALRRDPFMGSAWYAVDWDDLLFK